MTLANPGFIHRLKIGAPLNTADPGTYFGSSQQGYADGYTDYPALT
ncbi:hypothetical protein E3Z27_14510 [Pseudomonas mediterranea]|nr:hypothetical protein [Pseudomonas mediterranea]MDU9030211.1 hypothetical protein [Pseudomonas mediterranea]QHA82800.1 hypothetical protein E3Z27_14510 [Pseudomonas mediterranea]